MSLTREDLFQALEAVDEERLEHCERSVKRKSRITRITWVSGLAACFGLFFLAAVCYGGSFFSGWRNRKTEFQNVAKAPQEIGKPDHSSEADYQTPDIDKNEDTEESNVRYAFSFQGAVYLPVTSESWEVIEQYGLGESADGSKKVGDVSDMESAEEAESVKSEDGAESVESADSVGGEESAESATSSLIFLQAAETDLGEKMGVIQDCADESLNGCRVYHYAVYPEDEGICIVEQDGCYFFFGKSLLENEQEGVQ